MNARRSLELAGVWASALRAWGRAVRYALPMTTRWHDSWREGRTRFHQSDVHSDLVRHAERFLCGGPHRILVPLSGKTVDMLWLAELGHEVVGVELVPQALTEFFAEQNLEARESTEGGLRVLSSGAIKLVNADIFEVNSKHFRLFDRIWDRAALVALPPQVRGRYVRHLRSLAKPGALLLQNLFEYDQSKMEGPPFSVTDEEFQSQYEGAEVECLDETDAIEKVPQFRERGHEHWLVRNYLVTL
ncbi:MAG: thiopurine S-methyltransferase [Myxococcales bacterium]|nr:thiopurine S-methyltransferase [Myxococcales bacterium]